MVPFAAPQESVGAQGTRHTIRSWWAKRGEEMAFIPFTGCTSSRLVSLAPLFLLILTHESREVVQL